MLLQIFQRVLPVVKGGGYFHTWYFLKNGIKPFNKNTMVFYQYNANIIFLP